MIIKFESSFLVKNFVKLAHILNNDVPKSYPLTKDNDGLFELKKDEVMLFKIYKSKFERIYKKMFNKKHQHLHEHEVVRSNKMEKDLIDCDIMISNKYVHLIFSQGLEAINISKITEVQVDPRHIIIFTSDKHYQLFLNDIKLVLQVVMMIDVLRSVKLDDSFIGKNINIEINNDLKPKPKVVS